MDTDYIIVSRTESPELYNLLVEINKNDDIKKKNYGICAEIN